MNSALRFSLFSCLLSMLIGMPVQEVEDPILVAIKAIEKQIPAQEFEAAIASTDVAIGELEKDDLFKVAPRLLTSLETKANAQIALGRFADAAASLSKRAKVMFDASDLPERDHYYKRNMRTAKDVAAISELSEQKRIAVSKTWAQHTTLLFSNRPDLRVYHGQLEGFVDSLLAALGEQHSLVRDLQTKIATSMLNSRTSPNYGKAQEYFKKALATNIEILGEKNFDSITCRYNIGRCHWLLNELKPAATWMVQAADEYAEEIGLKSVTSGKRQLHTAMILMNNGRPSVALSYYFRALEAFEFARGKDSPESATVYARLADAFKSIQDYRKALVYAKKAHDLMPSDDPRYQRELAMAKLSLAHVHIELENTEEALNLIGEFEAIYEGQQTKPDRRAPRISLTQYANCLMSKANSLSKIGKSELAVEAINKSVDVFRAATTSTNGTVSPALQGFLFSKARIFMQVKRYEEALETLKEAREISRKYLVADLRNTAFTAVEMGTCLSELGRIDEAIAEFKTSASVFLANSKRQSLNFSMNENAFMNFSIGNPLRRCLNIVDLDNPNHVRSVYEMVWQNKGLGSRLIEAQHRALKSVENENLLALRDNFFAQRSKISSLLQAIALGDDQYLTPLEASEKERSKLIGDLLGKSNVGESLGAFELEQLENVLDSSTALVDFVLVQNSAKSHYVVAFILTYDGSEVQIQAVRFSAEELPLDSVGDVVTSRAQVRGLRPVGTGLKPIVESNSNSNPSLIQNRVPARVWERIRPRLTTQKTILISPDGPVNEFAWSTLPGKTGKGYAIEEGYVFVQVVSPQQLVRNAEAPAIRIRNAVCVGDLDFGNPPEGVASAWPSLTETRLELEQLKKTLPQEIQTESLSGDAVEKSLVLKRLASANLAHFATHGFIFDDFLSINAKANETVGQAKVSDHYRYHPYTSIGMVLSNANQRVGLSDGKLRSSIDELGACFLTGDDFFKLDLSRLDLAFFSSCSSAGGQSAWLEGKVGIQNAAHLAGARTTIGSLWDVSDSATRQLVELFYENLLVKKLGKAESLRLAQVELIRRGNVSPLDWGAWVLMGDWK